jgi:N-hydroxyarylamine O-acetyltransferase
VPRLDTASLQAKMVAQRRGGYCFEQNHLLRAALERLGYASRASKAAFASAPHRRRS